MALYLFLAHKELLHFRQFLPLLLVKTLVRAVMHLTQINHVTARQCILRGIKKKVSGPLLDRIDLHTEVPRINFDKLSQNELAESSASIRERVEAAREIQERRFKDTIYATNSEMKNKHIKEFCTLDDASIALLRQAVTHMHLSARSYHRIIKLARTIADLTASKNIHAPHVAEALQYRTKVGE